MSQPTSPVAGSPTGAASQGPEAMLAQILVQLQQGQAQIAHDTREGLQKLSEGLQSAIKKPGIVDVKGIGKPDVLKGTHDEVQKHWKSWSYKFETWFCSQWLHGQRALDWARLKGERPITADDMLTDEISDIDSIDAHLHVALVSLTNGMAYDVVFNSRKKCGLDAWRRLCNTYEPQNNRTNIRLLRRLLNPARATLSTMRSSLDRFEADLIEYEDRGQPRPSDETLRAILLSMVPENLEEHLELNIQRFDTYSKMRPEVVSFLEQKASKNLIDSGGAQPMEIDYVGGKGKGSKDKCKVCFNCQKPGHISKDCWHKTSKGQPSSSSSKGSKGKSGKGSKGSDKGSKGSGKGKNFKGSKSKGKGKGKPYAMDGSMEESWGTGEPEAEYQEESWNEDQWPVEEHPEEAGEQGALCVVSADSARNAPKQRPFTKAEKHLAGEQEQFMKGKIWKRPQQFWTMPYRLVCNQSCYDGRFFCGYQRCKSKGFDTPNKFMQHLYSKVDEDGHPRQQQLEAWNSDPYVPPKGFPPYGLWDPQEGIIRRERDEVTLRARSEPPPTKKKEKTWSMKETVDWQNKRWKGQSWRNWEEPDPNIKEENTNYPKNVRSPLKKSSPSGISKEEYEQQKKEMLRAMSERPEKEPKRTQEVRTVPESPKTKEKSEVLLKAKPKTKAEEKSKATSAGSARRPEMKSEEKTDEKPQAKAKAGLTAGAVSNFTQALVTQRLEEIKQLEGAAGLLPQDSPARKELIGTIKIKKDEIEKVKEQREKAKATAKATTKFSPRQEADRKAAGARVAYIKERGRHRAVENRASSAKARAVANVKKQEDAEARFNQPGTGRKAQTFPMSTGELAKEMQQAPLTRHEKRFRAEEEEEMPEVRKRKLGLPPSEVRRQEKKRLEKAKKKKDKKKDKKSKKEEDENESPEEDREEKEEGPEKDQEEEDLEKEVDEGEEKEDEEMDKEESSEPELMEEYEEYEDEEDEEDKDWQEWNPKAGSAGSARGWGMSGWFRRQQSHFWSGQYSEGKWEHDHWEDKKRSLYEPEESDRQTRPRIDFTHLKIQKALDVSKGKMGDSSEEEDEPKEEQEDEIKGLPRTPTGEETEGEAEEEEEKPEEGENQEVEDEGEEAKDPGGEEETEAQGDLNSFEAPPVSYKPSPNGPEGKDWTRSWTQVQVIPLSQKAFCQMFHLEK